MPNKDFTDLFLLFRDAGKEADFNSAFDQLVRESKSIEEVYPELFEKEEELQKEYDEKEHEKVNLENALQEKYINKPISFRAIVRGEAPKPYIFPTKISIKCERKRAEKCVGCGVGASAGYIELELENMNPLELIDCTERQRISLIKKKIGIMNCDLFTLKVIEQKYLQELFLSPIVEDVTSTINPEIEDKKEQRFFIRHAYCEGSEVIPNRKYEFFGTPTPSPKNQTAVFYLKKYNEEADDLDKFFLTDEDKENLKIFQPEGTIQEKLNDIYDDFSVNLSPVIRFRNDIMFAIDLSFHSVLNFWFGKSYERGYPEVLIVGDTSVGKSKISKKLIQHYKLGVFEDLEGSSKAGIIGGMQKFESANLMTWGLLPLNNSRLVILDELSKCDPEIFKGMTFIRSEGIASRVLVGGPASTVAKVRIVWLSNPKNHAIKLYDNGCEMLRELLGKDPDIGRFDFILTVSEDEVPADKINTKLSTGGGFLVKHTYKSELCNKLILWSWSRKASQVIFEEDLDECILMCANEMAKRYTSTFPLVLGSTIRIKLCKLAIALAARLFSTKDGENIYVTDEHVMFIFDWLNKIYNKPSFGYGEYSEMFRKGEEKQDENIEDLMVDIRKYCKDIKSFLTNMYKNSKITPFDIRDFGKCTQDDGEKLRVRLITDGYLIKESSYYKKSEKFRKVLRKELKEYNE